MPVPEDGHPFDSPQGSAPIPALRPWHPPDGLAGVERVNRLEEVLFTDGRWRPVTVLAQGRSGKGWAVLLEFHTDDTYQRWVLFDRWQFRGPREK